MNKQRALRLAREWAQGHKCSLRNGEATEYHTMFATMLDEAMKNEPLTLEQLRNNGNVPVWLVWGYEMSEWALIRPYDDTYMEALVFDGEGELFRIDEYGEEWKAYRRPPEGEDNA